SYMNDPEPELDAKSPSSHDASDTAATSQELGPSGAPLDGFDPPMAETTADPSNVAPRTSSCVTDALSSLSQQPKLGALVTGTRSVQLANALAPARAEIAAQ